MICSGSYHKIHSNSVGYKTDYEMFSMDFEEFLWAEGYAQEQIDSILNRMLENRPFNENEWFVFKSLFLDYCVLGGMSAIVSRYLENGTFEETLALQKQLLLDYEEDVRKYAEGLDQAKIINVYRSIPTQLAKENKNFRLVS